MYIEKGTSYYEYVNMYMFIVTLVHHYLHFYSNDVSS